MTAFPVNVYLLHNLLTVVQLVRQKMGQHLACLVYSEVYWIQIISQMFCGHPQAMNLGNKVKKKKETWILGQFVRKNQLLTSELWHLIYCCFYSFFFFKFPEDLLFVFCCRFRKNGFDILFTNRRTNQKFHVLVNLKALHNVQMMRVWSLGTHLHKVTHLPSSILWSITRVFRKMLTHTWMNAALQGSLSLNSLVM